MTAASRVCELTVRFPGFATICGICHGKNAIYGCHKTVMNRKIGRMRKIVIASAVVRRHAGDSPVKSRLRTVHVELSLGKRPPRNGDLPYSGKPKSAIVKTSEVAATCVARMVQFPATGLLCRKLRSPAEVSFSTTMPQLAAFWRPVRSLWEQDRRAEAFSAMAEKVRHAEQYANISIPTLLLMAQMQMENAGTVGAQRFLQSAMKQLGHQTGMPVKSSGPARSRISTVSATSRYALCGRDWLILAIQALLNHDLESCLLWIHHADRQVFDSVTASESPQRLRLVGDMYAVLACVAAQAGEMDESEQFLATAYQRHLQSEAFQAVCRDLILTARLAMLQGQSDRTQTLLDAAECQLVMALTADEADRSPLMDIIHSDRMRNADTSQGAFQQIRQVGKRLLSEK